jgi:hypothetical protein
MQAQGSTGVIFVDNLPDGAHMTVGFCISATESKRAVFDAG